MARRFHLRSTSRENLRTFLRSTSGRVFLIVPILLLILVPIFLIGAVTSNLLLPRMENTFYNLAAPAGLPTPTPFPPFNTILPQTGVVLYTVQDGDACDEVLSTQMRMVRSAEVFSDVKPATVNALNSVFGQDCHRLQPGLVLPLPPQYPLVALGGQVLKIEGMSAQQVLPTPLIHVAGQTQPGPDCSGGCRLTVRIAPQVLVQLIVQTTLTVHINSWVWAQAMMARKSIHGFDTYPYVDATANISGMSLRACNLQVDDIRDDNALSCDQLMPNTINDDGGSWVFGVTGPSGLDHWHYQFHLPIGTRVLLWLAANNGDLKFHPGDPLYRYDDTAHVYVKV